LVRVIVLLDHLLGVLGPVAGGAEVLGGLEGVARVLPGARQAHVAGGASVTGEEGVGVGPLPGVVHEVGVLAQKHVPLAGGVGRDVAAGILGVPGDAAVAGVVAGDAKGGVPHRRGLEAGGEHGGI